MILLKPSLSAYTDEKHHENLRSRREIASGLANPANPFDPTTFKYRDVPSDNGGGERSKEYSRRCRCKLRRCRRIPAQSTSGESSGRGDNAEITLRSFCIGARDLAVLDLSHGALMRRRRRGFAKSLDRPTSSSASKTDPEAPQRARRKKTKQFASARKARTGGISRANVSPAKNLPGTDARWTS